MGLDPNFVELVKFPCRNLDGTPIYNENIESKIHEVIKEAFLKKQIVVLHLVYVSKTGMESPFRAFIEKLKTEYNEQDIYIVVDASQFRCSKEDIKIFLNNGYIVILTGSKFMSGPPFSGK